MEARGRRAGGWNGAWKAIPTNRCSRLGMVAGPMIVGVQPIAVTIVLDKSPDMGKMGHKIHSTWTVVSKHYSHFLLHRGAGLLEENR